MIFCQKSCTWCKESTHSVIVNVMIAHYKSSLDNANDWVTTLESVWLPN